MRLALLIEQFDARGGGAQRSLAQIVQELIARDHDVTIICGTYIGRPELANLQVHRCFRKKRGSGLAAWRLANWAGRRLAEGRFDASLSVTTGMPATVIQPRGGTVRETLARNIALRWTPRARLQKRVLVAISPKQQVLLQLERRILADPAVHRFVAVSRYVRDQLQNDYRIDPARIELIPNAARMPVVSPDQRAAWRGEIRRDLGVAPGQTVYLFAAHNPGLKGAATVIRALRVLQDRGISATVLMAGCHRYWHVRQAAELQVRDRIRFLGLTNRMEQLYAASDVTVLPTYYDPSSKVVIESLMLGIPAITTRFNGAADFVLGSDHAPRGRVIDDPADGEALAAAMADLADPARRDRCTLAMEGLAEDLDMKRHVDRLERILEKAAELQ